MKFLLVSALLAVFMLALFVSSAYLTGWWVGLAFRAFEALR